MIELYEKISFEISKIITKTYSTSFSIATGLLDKDQRDAIYAIYGFVRLADEIVDTFHNFDKKKLIEDFEDDLKYALENQISCNPVLFAFAKTVKKYKIPQDQIDAFLWSMRRDLEKEKYTTTEEIKQYIYGSADVVGLMCLRVFVDGDEEKYRQLCEPAMRLGSAFQKVNFLRDLRFDANDLNRTYFPQLVENDFTEEVKKELIQDILYDFEAAKIGIKKLPGKSRFAVLTAYFYYRALTSKIEKIPAEEILKRRISVHNFIKFLLIIKAYFVYRFNLL